MNFRLSILISVVAHLLVAGSAYVIKENNAGVNVKQGVSSVAIKIANKNEKNNVATDLYHSTDTVRVLISDYGEYLISTSPIDNKASNKQNQDHARMQELRGALANKASLLSKNCPPEYPYIARKFRYEGKVILQIEILPEGDTGKIVVQQSSGYGILDNAAVSAVKSWRFFEKGQMSLFASVMIKQSFVFKMGDKSITSLRQ